MEKIMFKLTTNVIIDISQIDGIVSVTDLDKEYLRNQILKNKAFINLCGSAAGKTDENDNGSSGKSSSKNETIDSMEMIKSLIYMRNGLVFGVGFRPEKIIENLNNTVMAADKSSQSFYCPKTKRETRPGKKQSQEQ